jgi:hypothetical protein
LPAGFSGSRSFSRARAGINVSWSFRQLFRRQLLVGGLEMLELKFRGHERAKPSAI